MPRKKKFVNSATNTTNMANAATNTMTTEELLAPLASMEDLSILMTPMSTPGASPRTRARWSHRSSSGSQYEPFMPSPLTCNLQPKQPTYQEPIPPPRKSQNSLLKQSLGNNGVNKYVTPYRHDPSVMNADLPLPPVTFRRPQNHINRRTYPKIDEAEEYLLQQEENRPQLPTASETAANRRHNTIQFLTPRQHNHHQSCAYNNNTNCSSASGKKRSLSPQFNSCRHNLEFDEDRVKLMPKPRDR